jgi:hypothetical protein
MTQANRCGNRPIRDRLKSGSPFSVLRSPFSVLRSPLHHQRARLKSAVFLFLCGLLALAACTNPTNPAGPTLTGITVTPATLDYDIGDTFSRNSITVSAHYSDGSSQPVTDYTLTRDNETSLVDGYTVSTAGTFNVTVTYQDKTTTLTISVAPNTVHTPTATPPAGVIPRESNHHPGHHYP